MYFTIVKKKKTEPLREVSGAQKSHFVDHVSGEEKELGRAQGGGEVGPEKLSDGGNAGW